MRLLNTTTGRFLWVEDPREVPYAILSHVWSKDPRKEMTYQQVESLSVDPRDPIHHPSFSVKIRSFCKAAKDHGFEFGWADSCCIDKTSSSELSEAVTSMYEWYRNADMCFAYLHDVDIGRDADIEERNQELCRSQWFQRGWTLQELLAPSILLFFSKSWEVIGSKQASATHIANITNIHRDILTFKRSLDEVSVACRMSWAASRKTKREEDEAYCLMGIFGVSIPIIYGEGRYAFVRLQEEIIRTVPDQSIFAWGRTLGAQHPFKFARPDDPPVASMPNQSPVPHPPTPNRYLLASSPRDFEDCSCIIHLPHDKFARKLDLALGLAYQVFTVTAYGIHARLPLITAFPQDHHEIFPTHLALLACETQDDRSSLALLLRPRDENSGTGFCVGSAVVRNLAQAYVLGTFDLDEWHYRAVYLSLQDIEQIRRQNILRMTDLYLPHRPLRDASKTKRDQRIYQTLQETQGDFEVYLAAWSRSLLSLSGSRVMAPYGDNKSVVLRDRVLNPNLTPGLTIAYKAVHINIQIGHCKCTLGRHSQTILGVLVWSPHARSSLEEPFGQNPHRLSNPVHLHSWAFRDGVASTSVELQPISSPQRRLSVRLTLYRPAPQFSDRAYKLGVEVTTSEVGAERPSRQAELPGLGSPAYDVPAALRSSRDHNDPATSSRVLNHRPLVRDRPRSRSFSAPFTTEPSSPVPFDDALIPTPPLTTMNPQSTNHPAVHWDEHFSGPLRHDYTPQEPLKPSPRRSSTWNTIQSSLPEGQASLSPSRRHSFEESFSRTPRSGSDRYSMCVRDDSPIVKGRIVFGPPPSTRLPHPPLDSSVVLGDTSTGWDSRHLQSKALDGQRADFRGWDVPTVAMDKFSPRLHPRGGPPVQALLGDVGDDRAAPNLDVPRKFEDLDFARPSKTRPAPESPPPPDPSKGRPLPRPPWAEGEDPPSWSDVQRWKVPPPVRVPASEGPAQANQHLNLRLIPSERSQDTLPLVDDTSSIHPLPPYIDARSPPAPAAQESTAGRDAEGGNAKDDADVNGPALPVNGQSVLSSIPQVVSGDARRDGPVRSKAARDTVGVAVRPAGKQGEQEGGGTHKDRRRRRGLGLGKFWRKFGSS